MWKEKIKQPALKDLFKKDYEDLLSEMIQLPKTVTLRKINDVAKRAKAVILKANRFAEEPKKCIKVNNQCAKIV